MINKLTDCFFIINELTRCSQNDIPTIENHYANFSIIFFLFFSNKTENISIKQTNRHTTQSWHNIVVWVLMSCGQHDIPDDQVSGVSGLRCLLRCQCLQCQLAESMKKTTQSRSYNAASFNGQNNHENVSLVLIFRYRRCPCLNIRNFLISFRHLFNY